MARQVLDEPGDRTRVRTATVERDHHLRGVREIGPEVREVVAACRPSACAQARATADERVGHPRRAQAFVLRDECLQPR